MLKANLVLLLILVVSSTAFGKHIYVVNDTKNDKSVLFIEELKNQVWSAEISEIGISESILTDPSDSVIVAIGPLSLTKAIESNHFPKIPVISVFTSKTSYNEITSGYLKHKHSISAIFADSPLNDQLALITGIYNKKLAIGVILSDSTRYVVDELMGLKADYDVDFQFEFVDELSEISSALASLKRKGIDALLAVPDGNIYTSKSLKHLLVSSYRGGQTIVGFSENIVRAGALASVYYLPNHIAIDCSETIKGYFNLGRLKEPSHSNNFNVAVNRTIARSMNLYKNDPNELVERVKKNISFQDKAFKFVFMDLEAGDSYL